MGAPEQPAETWRAGDMAECIRDDWRRMEGIRHPQRGARAMVLGVDVPTCGCGHVHVFLQLLGFEQRWDARAFRKIVAPDVAADRRVDRPVEEMA